MTSSRCDWSFPRRKIVEVLDYDAKCCVVLLECGHRKVMQGDWDQDWAYCGAERNDEPAAT